MGKLRWFAFIDEMDEGAKVRQFVGLPPELTEGKDTRVPLPWPRVVVLELDPKQGALLYRYSQAGQFAGDTWHLNREDAEHQARSEYGAKLGEWREIPEEVSDAAAYALAQVP